MAAPNPQAARGHAADRERMPEAMEWRHCPSFPDYEVSDSGDLRRAAHVSFQPGRRLNGTIDADGYIRFAIAIGGRKTVRGAHQLVADAFLGPQPSPAHEVAHRNGSRLRNTPDNLRWSLCIDNQRDRRTHNTDASGERNPKAKLTEEDVRYIRRRYREIKLARGRVAELDEKFGICRGQIIRIARGLAWSHVR